MELLTKLSTPFQKLTFKEKEHQYLVEDKPLQGSVSGLIKQFYETPDFDAIAPYSAAKRGITTEEIQKEWKDNNLEAITRGSRVHLFGENYPYNRSLIPSCPQEQAVVKFWSDMPEHIILVGVELRMYHFLKLFGGTADIILFDTKTQTYIIADYKTNRDLYKNFKGKTMTGPFSHLLDCPLNHYVIQLSYYQLLLEQIGIKVSRRIVVWLDLEGQYTMINTDDVTGILRQTLNN